MTWIDRGCFWELDAPQRDPMWFRGRQFRLTGSNFGAAVGHSIFTTPDELLEEISGKRQKTFTPEQLKNMNRGVENEPIARKWYERKYGVKVVESGLCVPKWDLRIGASLDGEVVDQDGCIEIKCPKSIYPPLRRRSVAPRDRIYKTHYDQMQGGMAITGKKWCDYIVFCPADDECYTERVPFDSHHWEELYSEIREFVQLIDISSRLDPE